MLHPLRHLRVVSHHRHLVLVHCIKAGIPLRGILHDLSKFSPAEFISGMRYYQGDRSPNDREREIVGYSRAWLHHKGRNRHHFEYWYDVNPKSRQYEPVEMPIRFAAEMFCDRLAASKTYRGNAYTDREPLEYFLAVRARDRMHPETERLLEGWLKLLAAEGEDTAFAEVRRTVHDSKNRKG